MQVRDEFRPLPQQGVPRVVGHRTEFGADGHRIAVQLLHQQSDGTPWFDGLHVPQGRHLERLQEHPVVPPGRAQHRHLGEHLLPGVLTLDLQQQGAPWTKALGDLGEQRYGRRAMGIPAAGGEPRAGVEGPDVPG